MRVGLAAGARGGETEATRTFRTTTVREGESEGRARENERRTGEEGKGRKRAREEEGERRREREKMTARSVCNPVFNFLGQYAIRGLTNTDFTPDDDDGEDLPDPNDHGEGRE